MSNINFLTRRTCRWRQKKSELAFIGLRSESIVWVWVLIGAVPPDSSSNPFFLTTFTKCQRVEPPEPQRAGSRALMTNRRFHLTDTSIRVITAPWENCNYFWHAGTSAQCTFERKQLYNRREGKTNLMEASPRSSLNIFKWFSQQLKVCSSHNFTLCQSQEAAKQEKWGCVFD